jgi:hypothetical protein
VAEVSGNDPRKDADVEHRASPINPLPAHRFARAAGPARGEHSQRESLPLPRPVSHREPGKRAG